MHDLFIARYYSGKARIHANILLLAVLFAVLSLIVRPVKAQSDDYIVVYRSHSQKQNMLGLHPEIRSSHSERITEENKVRFIIFRAFLQSKKSQFLQFFKKILQTVMGNQRMNSVQKKSMKENNHAIR